MTQRAANRKAFQDAIRASRASKTWAPVGDLGWEVRFLRVYPTVARPGGFAEARVALEVEARAKAEGRREPIKPRRSHRGETCQPCGECRACLTDQMQYADLVRLRRLQRRAVALLKRAASDLGDEINAEGPDAVREHPILRGHARTLAAIEAFLGRAGRTEASR